MREKKYLHHLGISIKFITFSDKKLKPKLLKKELSHQTGTNKFIVKKIYTRSS